MTSNCGMGTTKGFLVNTILEFLFVVDVLAGRLVVVVFLGLVFLSPKINSMADSRLDADLTEGYLPFSSSGDKVYALKKESELSGLSSELPAL